MINYVIGDATYPVGDRPKIIAHICNDVGKWGSGFVLAISKKWPKARQEYRSFMARNQVTNAPMLGTVQFVNVERGIIVANMIAQRGISYSHEKVVDYVALAECMHLVNGYAIETKLTVHMPRIGTGLGGGNWTDIEKIVAEKFQDVDVFVYDLPVKK